MDIKPFLDMASSDHKHLCPRQILGVRIALKGMALLGMDISSRPNHLLVISETDGCFIDGLIAVSQCTVGHRTLRVEDYGKIAATFVNTKTTQAIRISPALDVREKADQYAQQEKRHYFAQLEAYQVMPDEALLMVQDVKLNNPLDQIISHSGRRTNCERCGEEIINERDVIIDEKHYCISCARGGYYMAAPAVVPSEKSGSGL